MSLEFWLIISAVIFVALGICLGYVFWGMDDTKEREVPEADDYRWED